MHIFTKMMKDFLNYLTMFLRDNENKDLFNSIPNSYGTMGYVTRAKINLVDSKKYVKLTNHKFDNSKDAFDFLKIAVKKIIDNDDTNEKIRLVQRLNNTH